MKSSGCLAMTIVIASCSETGEVSPLPRLGAGPNGLGGTLCMILDHGRVACTGAAAVPPQIGYGDLSLEIVAGLPPVDAVTISQFPRAACAISTDAETWCWGDNSLGTTGRGTAAGVYASDEVAFVPPAKVDGIPPTRAIASTDAAFCALTHDGIVWCWGEGRALAPLAERAAHSPVRIEGLPAAVEIAGSWWHACIRTDAGAIWCWGHIGGVDHREPYEVVGSGATAFVDDAPFEVCYVAGEARTCVDPQLEDGP